MSAPLVEAVLLHSRAEHASRLVLLVLAESAWRDGVTWRSQAEICARAKLAERTVRDAIEDLVVALGELALRTAQDRRRRFYVYRVLVGKVEPVDYGRIPGTVAQPFEERQESPPVEEGDDRQELPPVETGDDRQISAADDRQNAVARLENRKKTNRKRESMDSLLAAVERALLDVCDDASRRSGLRELEASARDITGYLLDDRPDLSPEEAQATVSAYADVLRDTWSFGEGRVTPRALARHWDAAAADYREERAE